MQKLDCHSLSQIHRFASMMVMMVMHLSLLLTIFILMMRLYNVMDTVVLLGEHVHRRVVKILCRRVMETIFSQRYLRFQVEMLRIFTN